MNIEVLSDLSGLNCKPAIWHIGNSSGMLLSRLGQLAIYFDILTSFHDLVE